MAAPVVTMQQLIEAGAHFGHQTRRWNPRMKPYIFGTRNSIHILDLSQTVPLFARALEHVAQTAAAGGKILFVGTKRQAQGPIAEAALASGQYYVNHRWLGGMLTNWKTISNSIKRLKTIEEQLVGDTSSLTKKEILNKTRERDKLELSLGGIRNMGGIPNVMFVVDANKEELAIKEANVLGIPVVAILDSNVSPDGIAFPVPANDDAARAIRLYCDSVARAATRGGQDHRAAQGEDLGIMVEPPTEAALAQSAAPLAQDAASAAVAWTHSAAASSVVPVAGETTNTAADTKADTKADNKSAAAALAASIASVAPADALAASIASVAPADALAASIASVAPADALPASRGGDARQSKAENKES